MKKVVYIFILLAVPLSLNAYTFTRALSVGSTGEDVRQLQKYLNSNVMTKIGESGPGSPGSESDYFGDKTKQAVIKLQNMFAPFVLYPAGLTVGSGYVGLNTIAFLNNIQGHSDAVPSTDPNAPVVESVTPTELKDGDTIVITGRNFSDANTVIVAFESREAYKNIKSTNNGTRIEIQYDSSIQKPFDEKFKEIGAGAKQAVLKQFPKVPVAVSVINDKDVQSNFKVINFNLK